MKHALGFSVGGFIAMAVTFLHCLHWSDAVAYYTGDTVSLLVLPGLLAVLVVGLCFLFLRPQAAVREIWPGVVVVFALSYAPIAAVWIALALPH